MKQHFCTCKVTSCKNHPLNHSEGCDPCIRKNLKSCEIPSCFWLQISDDFSGYSTYTYADFTDFLQKHQAEYEHKKAQVNEKTG